MVKNWHKNKWTNLQKDFLTLLKSLEIVKKLPGGVGQVAHHQASCPILLLIPTLPLAFLSRLMSRQCGELFRSCYLNKLGIFFGYILMKRQLLET